MEFKTEDLLSIEEIKNLINKRDNPSWTSDLIASKLRKYCFKQDNKFYCIDMINITYIEIIDDVNEKVKSKIADYVRYSIENLNEVDQENLSLKYGKAFKAIYKLAGDTQFFNGMLAKLSNDRNIHKIEFDNYKCQIHFDNGYIDMNDNKKFKSRVMNSNFITYVIPRNYVASSEENRSKIMKIIDQIYPNADDKQTVLTLFGAAMTGEAKLLQIAVFLIGIGSSGKSTVLEMVKIAFGEYVYSLKQDTFSINNNKADKTFNTFANKKHIRISWINEPDQKRMDTELFKGFVDGNIECTRLYQDGSFTFKQNSVVHVTSNHLPVFICDTGSSRRFKCGEHKSEFTDEKDKIDESKNVFMIDRGLLKKIEDDEGLKNALVDIIIEYGFQWNMSSDKKINYSQNFKDTKDCVIGANDIFTDFIDKHIHITDDRNDRISRNRMKLVFDQMFPDKHLNEQQIISNLKDKKLKYDAQIRCDKLKGCFYGVQLKNKIACDIFDNVNDEEQPKEQAKHKEYEPLKAEVAITNEELNRFDNIDNIKEMNIEQYDLEYEEMKQMKESLRESPTQKQMDKIEHRLQKSEKLIKKLDKATSTNQTDNDMDNDDTELQMLWNGKF